METVQLQCGHCKKIMAISVEHLGGRVHCPHCKGVVQTPPRTPAPAPPPPPEPAALEPAAMEPVVPDMRLQDRESIFAASSDSTDVVLGESARPRVEMPSEEVVEPIADEPEPEPDPDTELPKFKPRPVYDRGVFTMYALIFLVPYAILSTLAILYLLFMQGNRTHPLDMLPDPAPDPKKQGAPKQVSRIDHKYPLADHQRTTLGHAIQVGKDGDLLVTPEHVQLTDLGDLRLILRAKNTSKNTVFTPINEAYVRQRKETTFLPYSFLETKSRGVENLYNSYLEFHKGPKGDEEGGPESLAPREETFIVLTTDESYRKPHIAAIEKAKADESFTWRVQLRRGLVKWHGKDVSTTAVIGVDFTRAQIEEKKG
jgi:hypothetical protein